MSLIVAKFAFFQMEVKILGTNPVIFLQATLGKAPEVLNAIDVSAPPIRKLAVPMANSIMPIAIDNEPVIAPPPVGVNRTAGADPLPNNRPQLGLRGIVDHLGPDSPASFEQPDDGDFRRAPPPAALPFPAKVTFIDFHFPGQARGHRFLMGGDLDPEEPVEPVDRIAIESGQPGRLGSGQVLRKMLDQLPEPIATEFLIFEPHEIQS